MAPIKKKTKNTSSSNSAVDQVLVQEAQPATTYQMDYELEQSQSTTGGLDTITQKGRKMNRYLEHSIMFAAQKGIEGIAIEDEKSQFTESVAKTTDPGSIQNLTQVNARLATVEAESIQLRADIQSSNSSLAPVRADLEIIKQAMTQYKDSLATALAALNRYEKRTQDFEERAAERDEAHQQLRSEIKSMRQYVDTLMGVTRDQTDEAEPVPATAVNATKSQTKKGAKKASHQIEQEPKDDSLRPSRAERANRRGAQT